MPDSHAQVLVTQFLDQHGITRLAGKAQLIRLARAVNAIPWGEGRTLEEVLSTKNVGTCTGKHMVLQACMDVLEIPYRTVVCTFGWLDQGIRYPDDLHHLLQEGAWPHGHNFVQVKNSQGQWVDLDITWDPPLAAYGFHPLPEDWNGEKSFVAVSEFIERWDGVDIADKKHALVDNLTEDQRAQREHFLAGFIRWVESLHEKRLAHKPESALR